MLLVVLNVLVIAMAVYAWWDWPRTRPALRLPLVCDGINRYYHREAAADWITRGYSGRFIGLRSLAAKMTTRRSMCTSASARRTCSRTAHQDRRMGWSWSSGDDGRRRSSHARVECRDDLACLSKLLTARTTRSALASGAGRIRWRIRLRSIRGLLPVCCVRSGVVAAGAVAARSIGFVGSHVWTWRCPLISVRIIPAATSTGGRMSGTLLRQHRRHDCARPSRQQ